MIVPLSRNERIFLKEHYDRCTICGNSFKDTEMITMGYDKSSCMQIVCHNCISRIEPKFNTMYRPLPYHIPQPDDMLWRFMDLAKFISLLKEKSLYLTRIDQFDDPFECAIGLQKYKSQYDSFYKDFCLYAVSTPPPEVEISLTEDEIQQRAGNLFNQLSESIKQNRQSIFVNCWHKNSVESEAMWKLYVKDLTQGIAIQTTYERLYQALDKEPSLSIGEVNYIDYKSRLINMNDVQWFKRKSFEHEKEVRIIKWSPKEPSTCYGLLQPIDIECLIENIYVSPLCPPWFVDLITDILDKYGVNKVVCNSGLNAEVFYG